MSSFFSNIDDDFESNLFEEFDKDDVVNNSENSPYNFDEHFDKSEVVNKANKKEQNWISDDELTDFVKYGNDAKKAADLYKSLIDEPFESSVIKKADAQKKKIISAADIETILSYDEDSRKKDHFHEEFELKPETKTKKKQNLLLNSQSDDTEYLIQNFKDFIIAPKIAGAKVGPNKKNLIPQEYYEDKGNIVEIADDPATIAEEHRTQIEINRNKFGEIESILVTCKCGEKTFIQFDYFENNDNENDNIEHTEYISTTPNVEEMELNPQRKFNIDIPDEVIDDVIAEVEEDELKRAKPFEGEV